MWVFGSQLRNGNGKKVLIPWKGSPRQAKLSSQKANEVGTAGEQRRWRAWDALGCKHILRRSRSAAAREYPGDAVGWDSPGSPF